MSGVSDESFPSVVDQLINPIASWKLTLHDGLHAKRDLPYAVLANAAAVMGHVKLPLINNPRVKLQG